MKRENLEDIYVLSPLQQGMIFDHLYSPRSGVYFQQVSLALHGQLDIAAFVRSWQEVVKKYAALRTSFHWQEMDNPLQVVTKQVDIQIHQISLTDSTRDEQQKEVDDFLKKDRELGFDLSTSPLMRLTLIHLSETEYQLIWSYHHIILDGWSSNLIVNEVFEYYRLFCQGLTVPVESVPRYRDYISWLQKQDMDAAEAYWRQTLGDFNAPTSLSVDKRAGSIGPITNHGQYEVELQSGTTGGLQSLAKKLQCTMNTALIGAWAILLNRYSGEEDLVLGAVSSGRPPMLSGIESMVGLFINTLPLRVSITSAASIQDWLPELHRKQMEMRQYEYTPLTKVQGWSSVPRELRLFENIFILENYPHADVTPSGAERDIEIRSFEFFERVGYPLSVFCRMPETPESELAVRFLYDADRYDDATIERMAGHYQALLSQIVSNPANAVSKLTLLTEAERTQLLQDWNSTERPYSSESCLHKLFEAQAAQHPGKVAVVFGEEKVTYGELDSRANQLARYLQKQGIGSESLVGICVERSAAMVVGLLGVLKAGGAYVPMDPDYPSDRLAVMIEDSKVEVLLTESDLDNIPAHSGRIVYLDSDWAGISSESTARVDSGVGAENRAYVIYTSGSTGRPKGVQIEHRAVVNFLESMAETPGLGPNDVLMAVTTLSFDISILEIFLPLTVGGQVVVASREIASDGRLLAQAVSDSGTTVMQATPATWRMLLEVGWEGKEDLKILCGGEALPRELATQLMSRGGSLWNMYGPTETTIWSAVSEITDVEESVSIGPPIANTTFYVLDAAGEPVPIGVPGELHIGGVGLARGYLGRSELTSEKFIKDPFSVQEDARMYRTGDLVRYLPDGHIEFIARIDHQVKIRGFRIELGEIEAVLEQHESIQTAVVIAREDTPGDKRLVAYVGGGSGNIPDAGELRPFLQQKLPDYMVPSFFVGMKEFPLTPSGKIDRKALPEPDMQRIVGADHIMPTSLMETTIASIWQEILHVDNIGVSDNFFDLGGHSLLAMKFVSEMEKKVGYRISPRDMMFQSLGQLAAVCEKQSGPGAKKHPKRSRRKFLDTLKEVLS
jgi:amino acid adenylation domain-containing protein